MEVFFLSFVGSFPQREVVEVVEEVKEVEQPEVKLRITEAGGHDLSDFARQQLPEQTYFHAIGHSFPLVFNARTTAAPGRKYYGSLGI